MAPSTMLVASLESRNSSASKGKTSTKLKANTTGKKLTDNKLPGSNKLTEMSQNNVLSRNVGGSVEALSASLVGYKPSVKTPLAALLSKSQVKTGDASLMLVTVTVLGSPGPLRFLVDRTDTVSRVVEAALRVYAREGRLPALNSKLVELYCHNGDFKALDATQSVGGLGTRQFLLYRKKPDEIQSGQHSNSQPISHPFKHWWNLMSSIVCSH